MVRRMLNVLQVLAKPFLVFPILGFTFIIGIVTSASRLLSCFRCWPSGCSLCSRRHSPRWSRFFKLRSRLLSAFFGLGCVSESVIREMSDPWDPDLTIVRRCIVLCATVFYYSLVPSAQKRVQTSQHRRSSDLVRNAFRFGQRSLDSLFQKWAFCKDSTRSGHRIVGSLFQKWTCFKHSTRSGPRSVDSLYQKSAFVKDAPLSSQRSIDSLFQKSAFFQRFNSKRLA